ncbi:telomeric repeat-binding factor 1 [Pungitius pungitius]|uniref:telomeric repeat-binding factor 1 n=1 Tax=Pungitius pungitius TaxID=134920 RepID=UPI001888ED7B|nr:telomeric repeat-binding factor 1 [Pungitius pungitius]
MNLKIKTQNMEDEINFERENATAAIRCDESVNFSQVTSVANRWIFDFLFVSLCRRFKEDQFDEFNETLSTFREICPRMKGTIYHEKTMVCAFLARVIHGNELDVQFEEEADVMPLMSAAKIWPDLKNTVKDKILSKNITHLLLVQSVALCLEKGKQSSASSALRWYKNNSEFPQNLIVKLTTIVTRRETYHPFLVSFSFIRLLESIKSYLDAYLEKNPSDYLLKEATNFVKSSPLSERLEDTVTKDSSVSEEANKSTGNRKTKRKLLSTKNLDEWQSDSCKESFVSLRRMSKTDLLVMTSPKSVDKSKIKKTRKRPQKWTNQLDTFLQTGVKRHGQGNWSRILMDFDFEGRTGTMLKDRWRVLRKAHIVG